LLFNAILCIVAIALEKLGRYQEAQAYRDAAGKALPPYVVFCDQAYAQISLGRFDDADNNLAVAAELNPTYAVITQYRVRLNLVRSRKYSATPEAGKL